MKLRVALFFLIVILVGVLPKAHSELIRVRLMAGQEKVLITGSSLRFQNLSQPFQPVSLPSDSRIAVHLTQKSKKNVWSLRINNRGSERLFTDKFILIQGENLRAGTKPLPSRILLSATTSQKIDVVGVLSLEEYLVGVLASEMPLTWPQETLKAQAVAARSYALAVLAERRDRVYHLESSVLDQVFRHVMAGNDRDPLIGKALQAVRDTAQEKLYGPNNRILKAFFHSDCGGRTTTAKNVWSSGVNSGVAVDSSCPTNPKAQWVLSLPKGELSRRLGLGEIQDLEVLRSSGEDRIRGVRVASRGLGENILSANTFRQKLGFDSLRSSNFEMRREGDQFFFKGRGFGHGVGLCQWGSRSLGQRGMSYKQILAHYYPLASVK